MANLFSPDINKRVRRYSVSGAAVVFCVLGWLYYNNFFLSDYEPIQPIQFSHKLHAGELGMSCLACHPDSMRTPKAGVPDARFCMGCHTHILPDSPHIAPLRAAVDTSYHGYTGEPVQWVMVNRLAGHAFFDHMAHVNRGVGCTVCHGDVAGMERIRAPRSARMPWCMECHRDPVNSLRPLETVADINYQVEEYLKTNPLQDRHGNSITNQQQLGTFLQEQWQIKPSLNCTTCHH